MKNLKKIFSIFAVMVILTGAYAVYEYSQIDKIDPVIEAYTFNGQTIEYKEATIRYHLLGGLIPIDQKYTHDQDIRITSDQIFNQFPVSDDTRITVTAPDKSIQTYVGSQELAFEENGNYKIELDDRNQDGSKTHFEFIVIQDSVAKVTISNLNPYQGDVLIIDLSNIKLNSTITIDSHFGASAITQADHTARFYLPIEYHEAATTYPLSLLINGKKYDYTLTVKPFAFKKDYFTVDPKIVEGTVGNSDATNEFKNKVAPLYDLFEPSELWTGSFILPVTGAKQSSNFGDLRYVNGATTPTRHGGIDYAIACGTPIYASNTGKVQFADFLTIYGNTVLIEHGLGLKTSYYHMLDLSVKAGQTIEKGQLIGHVGTTGYSTGCHLHFQAMIKNQPINPDFLYKLVR